MKRSERRRPADPVSLVGKKVALAGLLSDRVDSEQETQRLAEEVRRRGGIVVLTLMQRRGVSRASKPGGAAAAHEGRPLQGGVFLGTGKLRELQLSCQHNDIDVVVFYNALDPAHRDTLQDLTGATVFDRVQLGLSAEEREA